MIRELEKQVLAETVKKCVELKVDFVLISGDLFHVSIPDLSVVNDTIRTLRLLQDAKIPIYMIYGSHDYTPNGISIIDILDTAGIIVNVMKPHIDDDRGAHPAIRRGSRRRRQTRWNVRAENWP